MAQGDRDDLDFWALFAAAVEKRALELNAQELSMCTWAAAQALATSTAASPPSVASFTRSLVQQELSMCTWAAAQALATSTAASPPSVASFTAAVSTATNKLADTLEAQQLATLAAALTKLGLRKLTTLAAALTKLGCSERRTLLALAKGARRRVREFNAQDLDNLASGFARHELQAGAALFSRERAPPQNIANLLLAIAKLVSTAKVRLDPKS
ncbi:hypothetical protein T484DRAFT_1844745 [Baffinella frigidus]|nr:hypothetical protein T484DRAFT_1844745 [Cryptophyta sp. CCMP2293]